MARDQSSVFLERCGIRGVSGVGLRPDNARNPADELLEIKKSLQVRKARLRDCILLANGSVVGSLEAQSASDFAACRRFRGQYTVQRCEREKSIEKFSV